MKLANVLQLLKAIQKDFKRVTPGRRVSLADLIVLGGCVEAAAKEAGNDLKVPFSPGNRGSLGCDDAKEAFVKDFVAVWNKVMNLDRYDLQ